MKAILFLSAAAIMLAGALPASAQTSEETVADMTVKRIVVCESIVDREPVGAASEFGSDIGKVYCFTEISCPQPPASVEHVWYREAEEVSRVPLDVTLPRMRTWSYKTITGEMTGAWKVEVLSGDTVLDSVSFSIRQEKAAPR